MTRMILTASFALFGAFTAYADPQDADAPEDSRLAFPTEIEQVTVDVVVTDKDGQPISDLSAAEFEIEEDGKRQTITSFELFEVEVPADREPVETAVGTPAPAADAGADRRRSPATPTRRSSRDAPSWSSSMMSTSRSSRPNRPRRRWRAS